MYGLDLVWIGSLVMSFCHQKIGEMFSSMKITALDIGGIHLSVYKEMFYKELLLCSLMMKCSVDSKIGLKRCSPYTLCLVQFGLIQFLKC